MAEERLHKIMAAAGFGSRRACEQMIIDGLVEVDGRTITEVGVKVDPTQAEIVVNGKKLELNPRHIYIKINKPRGVISDIGGDTGSHRSVEELLPKGIGRVFPVGRLDLNSEGLVLLTDDGELAHHLTHPSFEHPKTYYALVAETPGQQALEALRGGIDLPEGRTAPARVSIVEGPPAELMLAKGPSEGVWLEIVLREGRKRQIRHMLAAVDHPVLRLARWAIGPLTLGRVRPGDWQSLRAREAAALREFAGLPPGEINEIAKEERPRRDGPARRDGPPRGPRRDGPPRRDGGRRAGPRPYSGPRRERDDRPRDDRPRDDRRRDDRPSGDRPRPQGGDRPYGERRPSGSGRPTGGGRGYGEGRAYGERREGGAGGGYRSGPGGAGGGYRGGSGGSRSGPGRSGGAGGEGRSGGYGGARGRDAGSERGGPGSSGSARGGQGGYRSGSGSQGGARSSNQGGYRGGSGGGRPADSRSGGRDSAPRRQDGPARGYSDTPRPPGKPRPPRRDEDDE